MKATLMRIVHYLKANANSSDPNTHTIDMYKAGARMRIQFETKEEYDSLVLQLDPNHWQKEIFLPYIKDLREVTNNKEDAHERS